MSVWMSMGKKKLYIYKKKSKVQDWTDATVTGNIAVIDRVEKVAHTTGWNSMSEGTKSRGF